jgi:hypothetical protein
LPFRFRETGFGLTGPRTAATALFTNFTTVNLADADEPINIIPRAIVTTEITRTLRVWVLEIILKEVVGKSVFMGELLIVRRRVN